MVAEASVSKGDRMDVHENARLTWHSRAELVRRVLEEGQARQTVADAFGVCPKTVKKWVERFQAEGLDGLHDRSSRPHSDHVPRGGVGDRGLDLRGGFGRLLFMQPRWAA